LKRPCYIGLYEDAIAARPQTSDNVQEAILFSFAVSNGSFKRTSRNRFGVFDEATIEILRAMVFARDHFVVHDLAVSDARTASEFFARLAVEFNNALDFYATDLCLKVIAVRKPGARTIVVVDERGNVLQVMFEPFVLPTRLTTRRQRWCYLGNRGLRMMLMRTSVRDTLRLHNAGNGFLARREILLVCPEARETLKRCSNFHINTYDAFQRAPRPYSVVRAMNVLNRSYFADSALTTVIANIADSLEDGGVFITGSNGEAGSTVDGTIYRKQSDEFVPIYMSGNGSQIDDLIRWTSASLSHRPVRPASMAKGTFLRKPEKNTACQVANRG
jgi:hypothetical protein